MEGFLTPASLMTYGGCVAAVCAITEILKPLLEKLPVRIGARTVSYAVAAAVSVAAALISGKNGAADIALCFINAALVALSANGGYDLSAKLHAGAEQEENDDNNA